MSKSKHSYTFTFEELVEFTKTMAQFVDHKSSDEKIASYVDSFLTTSVRSNYNKYVGLE